MSSSGAQSTEFTKEEFDAIADLIMRVRHERRAATTPLRPVPLPLLHAAPPLPISASFSNALVSVRKAFPALTSELEPFFDAINLFRRKKQTTPAMSLDGPCESQRPKPVYRRPKWINEFDNLDPWEIERFEFTASVPLPAPEDVRFAERMFFPHLKSRRHFRNLLLVAPLDAALRYALTRTDRFDHIWKELYFKASGGINHHVFPIRSPPMRLFVLNSISRYLHIRGKAGRKGKGHGKPGSKKQGGGGPWGGRGGKKGGDKSKDVDEAGPSGSGEGDAGEAAGAAGDGDDDGGDQGAGGDPEDAGNEDEDPEFFEDEPNDALADDNNVADEMAADEVLAEAAGQVAGEGAGGGAGSPFLGLAGAGDMFAFGGVEIKDDTHAALQRGYARITVASDWWNEGVNAGVER
ncbi:hypothetical protein BJ508DRAFT_375062 [Ascobolus immersus RN42]|uniref:Uncharacterized protein n=1 Tax=Ascobolus immersus RN42 TaxID=1160509 RepID=A0A3N4IHB6_ASCIM|nr:hypothetical protein BJ508DRAFT_375062 [Ascobolus immersus RN42]